MIPKHYLFTTITLVTILMLTSCGQKGPLHHPTMDNPQKQDNS
ncbi:MAG: lipoprotein [Candidatus Thiodiazotropha sp. LLP2]